MYKVLIVDDEPIVKIALRSIIDWNQYGYSICATASDGQEALSLTAQYCPDLIITDLKMPVMDGISLIKALKKQKFAGEILVISNYDDFDYVRSALVLGAVDYILKVSIEEENLTKHLKTITVRLGNRYGHNASSSLGNYEQSNYHRMEFQQQLKEFLDSAEYTIDQLKENYPFYCVKIEQTYTAFYLNFNVKNHNSPNIASNTLISNSIESALEDISDKDILFFSHNTVLILIPMDLLKERYSSLEALAHKFLSIFELYMSVSPTIIFQEKIKGYQDLKNWYAVFLGIVSLCFYESTQIVHAIEFRPIHYINFIYYKEFAKMIHQNKMNHLNNSIEMINEIIEQCKQHHVYPEIIKVFFTKTIDLIEFLNPSSTIEVHDYLTDLKEAIYTCETSTELSHLVVLSIETIFLPPVDSSIDLLHIKVEAKIAMEYINNNYNRRVSLTSIAEQVNLSSGYLCRLFKSEVGMSITNYINQVRMEKAAALLRTSNLNVYMKEISAAVGIEDQLYFSRIFKRYYKMSPSEYRLNQQNEKMENY